LIVDRDVVVVAVAVAAVVELGADFGLADAVPVEVAGLTGISRCVKKYMYYHF
jgi:hypothetical protein